MLEGRRRGFVGGAQTAGQVARYSIPVGYRNVGRQEKIKTVADSGLKSDHPTPFFWRLNSWGSRRHNFGEVYTSMPIVVLEASTTALDFSFKSMRREIRGDHQHLNVRCRASPPANGASSTPMNRRGDGGSKLALDIARAMSSCAC